MRSRILSLWLPDLATDRLLRSVRRAAGRGDAGRGDAAWDPKRPLATFVNHQGALRLEALCARARAAGLAPGMMLADARAMVPALQVQAADPAADVRLLEDLAAWCERYTPYVALDRSHEHAAGGGLWLDVTGCAHLFGGEAALREDLLARLCRQGLAAAVAIADTPGAAWAVARYGETPFSRATTENSASHCAGTQGWLARPASPSVRERRHPPAPRPRSSGASSHLSSGRVALR